MLKTVKLEHCLLSAVVKELETLEPEQLEHVRLVLPTYRMSVFVMAALLQKRGAFYTPQAMNWNQFLDGMESVEGLPRPVSQTFAEMCLSQIIRQKRFRHVLPGHEHELVQLFSEIFTSGRGETAFEMLRTAISEESMLAHHAIPQLLDRVGEIETSFIELNFILASHSLALAGDVEWQRTQRILNVDFNQWTDAYPIIIAGLTTALPIHQPIIQKLAALDHVRCLLSEAPKLSGERNPLAELQEPLLKASQEVGFSGSPPSTEFSLLTAENPFFESSIVVDQVFELIKQGIKPSTIAIILSSESAYGTLVTEHLVRLNIPHNLAIGFPLSQTVLGQFLATLIDWVQNPDEQVRMASFMTNPLICERLAREDPKKRNRFTIRQNLLKTMTRQILAGNPRDRLIHLAKALGHEPNSGMFAIVQSWLDAYGLGTVKYADQWLQSLKNFLEGINIRDHNLYDMQDRFDGWVDSSLTAFDASFHEMQHLFTIENPELSLHDFCESYFNRMFSAEVRKVGDPMVGVQILSIEESRYIPFEHVFVLGCIEGLFPKKLPADYLVDDYQKQQMGLSGWRYLEAMEETSFSILKDRVLNLNMAFPRFFAGVETHKSRYIDKLTFAGSDHAIEKQKSCLLQSIGIMGSGDGFDQEKLKKIQSPYLSPVRQERLLTLSASTMTQLIRCPVQFLAGRYHLQPEEFPRVDDPRELGTLLHRILELFYKGAQLPSLHLEPLTFADDIAQLCIRLESITDVVLPDALKSGWLPVHLKHFAWPRFAAFFVAVHTGFFQGQSLVSWQEMAFGMNRSQPDTPHVEDVKPAIDIGDHRVNVVGFIDHVEQLSSGVLIIDYKLRGTPPAREIKDGLIPQLPLYGYLLHQAEMNHGSFDIESMVTGYWSILGGEWQFVGGGEGSWEEFHNLGLISGRKPKPDSRIKDQIARFKHLLDFRFKEIIDHQGQFLADTSACGYCSYSGVCRKNDPRFMEALNEQQRLAMELVDGEEG